MIDPTIVTGVIGVVGGGLGVSLVQGWFTRRKTSADASKINTDAAQILLDKTLDWASRLTTRIEKLEARVAEQEALIHSLTEKNAILEAAQWDKKPGV